MIEIEKKFLVEGFDQLKPKLLALVSDAQSVVQAQSDEYFNHEQLRFEIQDIALRIRSVEDRCILTYKGPNRDAKTKIRDEIEVDLSEEQSAGVIRVLKGIGLYSTAVVRKTRENYPIQWEGSPVNVSLDTVEEVGCFVELEIVAEAEQEVPAAVKKLESLASELSLSESTTTSYLEMLLRNRGEI